MFELRIGVALVAIMLSGTVLHAEIIDGTSYDAQCYVIAHSLQESGEPLGTTAAREAMLYFAGKLDHTPTEFEEMSISLSISVFAELRDEDFARIRRRCEAAVIEGERRVRARIMPWTND